MSAMGYITPSRKHSITMYRSEDTIPQNTNTTKMVLATLPPKYSRVIKRRVEETPLHRLVRLLQAPVPRQSLDLEMPKEHPPLTFQDPRP